MSRTLIVVGLLIVAVGLLWPWLGRLPIGQLPGDIVVRRDGVTLYIPITTMLLVSAALSLVFWLIGR